MDTVTDSALEREHISGAASPIDVTLLTGGVDRPYAYGLAMALLSKSVSLDVIGSDVVDSPEMHSSPNLRFYNMWPARRRNSTLLSRLSRTLRHYAALVQYAASAKPRVFHILWNSKVRFIDRTLLMLYYKMLGKKTVLTAHNVNQRRRDSNDSLFNRITLRIQYRLVNHIFVHTQKMKEELIQQFGVSYRSVTVIRHPINNAFPDTALTPLEAKRHLGITGEEKTILFFGRIKPYKGVEHLLAACQQLMVSDPSHRLIIAGEVQRGDEKYFEGLRSAVISELNRGQIILKTQFIPDEDIELYLKCADVLVLPYNEIFQSGVLFLSLSSLEFAPLCKSTFATSTRPLRAAA